MIASQIIALIKNDHRLGQLFYGEWESTDFGAMVAIQNMAPLTPADFELQVDQIIAPHGWYRTRRVSMNGHTQFFLEAISQPTVHTPTRVFHATSRANRASIERSGLQLTGTSSTWTERSYQPPRVHFARTISDALTFIESKESQKPALLGITKFGVSRISKWDIYAFAVADEDFRADIEMKGAIWTIKSAPANRLRRLSSAAIRSQGAFGYLMAGQWAAARALALGA